MWSLRAAGGVRLAVAGRAALRSGLPNLRGRLAVRACASHAPGSSDNGSVQHFTVTTPLYYVNAGERRLAAGELGPAAQEDRQSAIPYAQRRVDQLGAHLTGRRDREPGASPEPGAPPMPAGQGGAPGQMPAPAGH